MLLMCTYFQQTTDMTMTTLTEALQQKQNNIQLYTKTIDRSRGAYYNWNNSNLVAKFFHFAMHFCART